MIKKILILAIYLFFSSCKAKITVVDENLFKPLVTFTTKELSKRLTSQQYQVTQTSGHDDPNSGKYVKHHEPGKYNCIVCDKHLFNSKDKLVSTINSPQMWPLFYEGTSNVAELNHEFTFVEKYIKFKIVSNELRCLNCGSFIGKTCPCEYQIAKTYKLYSANSSSLDFIAGQPEEVDDDDEVEEID